jgi:hypothetical protein
LKAPSESTATYPRAWGTNPAYDAAVYFAQRGYVYVYQDVRGRHESDGRWEPFFDDEKDGYDTVEWAAKQPWSDGKVAMQGGSYLGQNQWRAAQAAPPSLVTIFPMVASTSLYHDWITLNGVWRLSFNFGWGPGFSRRFLEGPGAGFGHLWKTTDGGASWTDVSGNLPDVPVNDVMLLAGKIVVATDLGVVVSANGGATWSRLGSNLPYTTALDITLGPDGKLYAATHGRGIWSIPQP